MRSLFHGVIGFGLVSIPIQVFKAMDDERIAVHWLHRVCQTRIRYQKYCPTCDRAVTAEELAKGVALPDGRYVILPDDFAEPAPAEERRTITILSFPKWDEIDPVYLDTAYWLKPGTGGAKPYALLVQTLRQEQRVALADMRLRDRRSLAVVRPFNASTLMLHRMHYPEHFRQDGAHLGPEGVALTAKEAELAATLVAVMAEPFDPGRYPNEERARRLALIESLTPTAVQPPTPATHEIESLMAALKASVEQLKRGVDAGAAR